MVQFSDVRAAASADSGKGGKTYSMLVVRVSSAGKVEQVQDAITKTGLRTYSILDASKSLRRFFGIFDIFLGVFGSLALTVASLAIVNTLVMAVLERRREIGVMKALGAGDGDVKRLFFAEAGAMGFVGGVFGVGLGWLIGRIINLGTTLYLKSHNLPPENFWVVPWWLVGWVLLFSVAISLAAALYPASRAAKLDPIQALRYE
jgi:putative ABC transport system permease protein